MRTLTLYRSARLALPVAVAALLAAGPALAATATSNFNVTASVANNCTISAGALAFGAYDPVVAHATTDLDSTGTVTVACTKGTAATIGLGLGSNASGTTRRMTNGTDYLTYEIYQDASRSTLWSDSGAGLLSPAAAPSRAARNFTSYGRVPQAQDVSAGAYTDTVVATVNF